MHELINAAEIINSNLIYSTIIKKFNHLYSPQDVLLLVPTIDKGGDLEVVEAIGRLPNSLRYRKEEVNLDDFSLLPINKNNSPGVFSNYHNFIRITNSTGEGLAYLLFTLKNPSTLESASIDEFIQQTTSLLKIKHAVNSLPDLIETQSKLKYQLSFFSSTINNIFEPYGIEMLIQLYMEIISEMFLLPTAIALIANDGKYLPLYAKGINVNDYSDFTIDTKPFLENRQLGLYPFLVAELTPNMVGAQNYEKLTAHEAHLISPITWGDNSYLIICMSSVVGYFDAADKASLMALNNTIRHAVQFNATKNELLHNNNALDKKIFLLTSIYQAAQLIFSEHELEKTLSVSLDMLMEIFQSETSSIVIKNLYQDSFKLKQVKSVNHLEDIQYTFAGTDQTNLISHLIFDFTNTDDKEVFSRLFPELSQLEDELKPRIIAHLKRENQYYGFITLSDRVTGQTYDHEDKELLTLLLASITIAIENCLMLGEMQEKNRILDKSLQNIYAIQEVLDTIRKADSIGQFAQLLMQVLELGLSVKTATVLAKDNSDYITLYSNANFDYLSAFPELNNVSQIGIYNLPSADKLMPTLVIPITRETSVQGYLLIHEFTDTPINDSDKMQILTIIALIITETFNNLLEKHVSSTEGVINYPLLISTRIIKELEQMAELGLNPSLLRFHHPKPQGVIIACQGWSEGFVVLPNVGVIISPLDKSDIITQINQYTEEFQFLSLRNTVGILEQLFTF